jgi:uncharacterized protein (TIGR02246 family)
VSATQDPAAEAASLETALYDALVRGDLDAVDRMLAAEATYVHSNGVAETREGFLAALRAGLYTYAFIRPEQSEVTILPGAVIVTGRVSMSVGPRGGAQAVVPLLSTLVFIAEEGRWRLLRRHATRIPEAPRPSLADDKDAIREVMARYCHALDAGRFDAVAALFTPRGEWTTDYGAATGPAEIEAFLTGLVPRKGEGPQRKHYITNIVIRAEGDSAEAVSDYLIIRESGTGLIPVMGGTYKDRFLRHEGRWLFSRKELVHDIAGDMALKPR